MKLRGLLNNELRSASRLLRSCVSVCSLAKSFITVSFPSRRTLMCTGPVMCLFNFAGRPAVRPGSGSLCAGFYGNIAANFIRSDGREKSWPQPERWLMEIVLKVGKTEKRPKNDSGKRYLANTESIFKSINASILTISLKHVPGLPFQENSPRTDSCNREYRLHEVPNPQHFGFHL